MKLNKIHHVAVICSDYEQSKYISIQKCWTGKQFVFFSDPDGLPIKLYEK